MLRLPAFALTLWLASTAIAQSLVKDINSTVTNGSAAPSTPVVVGSTGFFSADDRVNGIELWKTDGSTAGTVLVRDIAAGGASSRPTEITEFAGGVVFAADDRVNGIELWKSDGTAAGTVLVSDLAPGTSSSRPVSFAVLGVSVYFFATVSGIGRELYKYNGATVSLVRDILPGAGNGIFLDGAIVNAGGTLFFAAVDAVATNQQELWKSDGTTPGTVLVANINPNPGGGSAPSVLTTFGSKLLFAASNGTVGVEPWISDGTVAGTFMLQDCWLGPATSNPNVFIVNGAQAFFPATDGNNTGRELYVTNGTVAGTKIIKELSTGTADSTTTNPTAFARLGAGCCFQGIATGPFSGNTGAELWYTNGTAAGTALIKDFVAGTGSSSPQGLFHHLGSVYMQINDGSHGYELGVTDGTLAGTVLVKDILPGSFSSLVGGFASLGATLLCTANNGSIGTELWKSDGTTAGTTLVKDINTVGSNPPSSIGGMTKLGTKAYFAANDGINGTELWVTDGTAAGTTMVKDIFAGGSSAPQGLVAHNGKLYFSAIDAAGREPWVSDGTAAGTVMLADCWPGASSSNAAMFTGAGNKVFFQANDGTATVGTGTELYVTDGTPAGTSLVTDLNAGTLDGFPASTGITALGTSVMFCGDNGTTGPELFVSNGTAAGTTLVKDIQSGAAGSSPTSMKTVGAVVYLQAAGGTSTSDRELWRSDGTAAGTLLVSDINAGTTNGSQPRGFTELAGKVYFAADNGVALQGTELWVTDGTPAGTTMVKDIDPGAPGSSPSELTVAGGTLFFVASDATNGLELWSSDGNGAGTVLVKDLNPGVPNGGGAPFAIGVGKRVIYQGSDGVSGSELFVSDGTAGGTTQVFDLFAGAGSSAPENFVVLGNNLLFSASDGVVGTELFSISLTQLGASEAEIVGVNCKGFGNPTIGTSGGAPFIGNGSFAVTLTSAVASTPCALYLNNSRSDTPVSGCIIYPTLFPTISVSSTTNGAGAGTLALPIPNVPVNIGTQLWFQWVAIDVGGPIFGLASTSQGLRIRIGQS